MLRVGSWHGAWRNLYMFFRFPFGIMMTLGMNCCRLTKLRVLCVAEKPLQRVVKCVLQLSWRTASFFLSSVWCDGVTVFMEWENKQMCKALAPRIGDMKVFQRHHCFAYLKNKMWNCSSEWDRNQVGMHTECVITEKGRGLLVATMAFSSWIPSE